MQLVDPEEIPAMERLTQEVLVLREKVAIAESQGQEATGSRRQQVVCQWGRLGCVCISAGAWLGGFVFSLWICQDVLVLEKLGVCGCGNTEERSVLLQCFSKGQSFESPGMMWAIFDTSKRKKGTPSSSGTTRYLL